MAYLIIVSDKHTYIFLCALSELLSSISFILQLADFILIINELSWKMESFSEISGAVYRLNLFPKKGSGQQTDNQSQISKLKDWRLFEGNLFFILYFTYKHLDVFKKHRVDWKKHRDVWKQTYGRLKTKVRSFVYKLLSFTDNRPYVEQQVSPTSKKMKQNR